MLPDDARHLGRGISLGFFGAAGMRFPNGVSAPACESAVCCIEAESGDARANRRVTAQRKRDRGLHHRRYDHPSPITLLFLASVMLRLERAASCSVFESMRLHIISNSQLNALSTHDAASTARAPGPTLRV